MGHMSTNKYIRLFEYLRGPLWVYLMIQKEIQEGARRKEGRRKGSSDKKHKELTHQPHCAPSCQLHTSPACRDVPRFFMASPHEITSHARCQLYLCPLTTPASLYPRASSLSAPATLYNRGAMGGGDHKACSIFLLLHN